MKFDNVKQMMSREWKSMLLVIIGILAVAYIAFFKESFANILRAAAGFIWLFIIPGWFLMSYWRNKLTFTQRMLFGTMISAALTGMFSYYLGLWVLGISKQIILLPLALIAVGIYFSTWAQPSIEAATPPPSG